MSDARAAVVSRRGLLAGATALAVLTILRIPAGAQEAPSAFMDKVGQEVVATFGDASLNDQERLARLVSILDKSVDFEIVGRLVSGRYWRQASPAQQQEFVDLFRQFTIETIASQLRNYGGETYEITGERVVDDRDTVVSSKIVRVRGQPPANVDWRVRRTDDGFKIIDVVGEGVSAVVTWRQEYGEVLERSGFDGVIARLKEQIAARRSA
ncbi:MAG TPA: ABC transporter substrate-binding protein [Geminicoccus sp.]|uniref:MlaC/ttg2D family ABC transporter substrate-binding protein n=1 Tax=Geminicoccus sp. TaxID=2024832 RepID=UPI002BCCCE96|nr:ABC transporter substrate-binding protein [Geminicoccus sp.]HWL70350.1 ABC transporter substrate-binding protein [Geminicoccus sp.]